MEYKDYYKSLGVSRNASQDEIKRAYRKLARKYHPDVSKEKNAEKRFKELGEAYKVLKDSQKRTAYDQLGNGWQAGEEFRPPPNWNANFDFSGSGFTGANFDFSDFFESRFGDTGQSHPHTNRNPFQTANKDQHSKIAISLEDAYNGTTRTLQLQMPEVNSNGQIHNKVRTLNVKIPKGVTQGQQIRLRAQGPAGVSGQRGDLYLEIEFQPHRLYRVEKRDIYLTLPVTPWEVALGSTVLVPTLSGKVELKIPANSQSGQKLRLKEQGFPGKPGGDLYIVLQVVTPKADTQKAIAFYHKMAQELPFNPRADLSE